jgi:hypothetical protein
MDFVPVAGSRLELWAGLLSALVAKYVWVPTLKVPALYVHGLIGVVVQIFTGVVALSRNILMFCRPLVSLAVAVRLTASVLVGLAGL